MGLSFFNKAIKVPKYLNPKKPGKAKKKDAVASLNTISEDSKEEDDESHSSFHSSFYKDLEHDIQYGTQS